MRSKSILGGLLLLALGSGCELGWKCPEYDSWSVSVNSGTFTGKVNDYRSGQPPTAVDKKMVVDRAAGTATISFLRNGKQVVETWKLSPMN